MLENRLPMRSGEFVLPGVCSVLLHLFLVGALAADWKSPPEVVWIPGSQLTDAVQLETPAPGAPDAAGQAQADSQAEQGEGETGALEEAGGEDAEAVEEVGETDGVYRVGRVEFLGAAVRDLHRAEAGPAQAAPERRVVKRKSVGVRAAAAKEAPEPPRLDAALSPSAAAPAPMGHVSSATAPPKPRVVMAAAVPLDPPKLLADPVKQALAPTKPSPEPVEPPAPQPAKPAPAPPKKPAAAAANPATAPAKPSPTPSKPAPAAPAAVRQEKVAVRPPEGVPPAPLGPAAAAEHEVPLPAKTAPPGAGRGLASASPPPGSPGAAVRGGGSAGVSRGAAEQRPVRPAAGRVYVLAAGKPAGEQAEQKPAPAAQRPAEPRYGPRLKGDLELEFIGKEIAANGIRVQALFRDYPRNRHKRAMSAAESKKVTTIVPKSSRTGMNTVQTVLETAADGIYELRGHTDGGRPQEVAVTLTIHGAGSRPVVKRLGTRKVGGDSYLLKVMMPEGVLWDDDEGFSGSIQDSDGVTKYNSDSGLVWKEYNGN